MEAASADKPLAEILRSGLDKDGLARALLLNSDPGLRKLGDMAAPITPEVFEGLRQLCEKNLLLDHKTGAVLDPNRLNSGVFVHDEQGHRRLYIFRRWVDERGVLWKVTLEPAPKAPAVRLKARVRKGVKRQGRAADPAAMEVDEDAPAPAPPAPPTQREHNELVQPLFGSTPDTMRGFRPPLDLDKDQRPKRKRKAKGKAEDKGPAIEPFDRRSLTDGEAKHEHEKWLKEFYGVDGHDLAQDHGNDAPRPDLPEPPEEDLQKLSNLEVWKRTGVFPNEGGFRYELLRSVSLYAWRRDAGYTHALHIRDKAAKEWKLPVRSAYFVSRRTQLLTVSFVPKVAYVYDKATKRVEKREDVTVKEFESDLKTARTVDLERYKLRAISELNTFSSLSCMSRSASIRSQKLTRIRPAFRQRSTADGLSGKCLNPLLRRRPDPSNPSLPQ